MEKETRRDVGPIVLAGLILMVIFVCLRGVAQAFDIFLIGFFAILLGIIFDFPIRFFSRWLPRSAALLLTLLGLFGTIAGLIFLIGPIFLIQGQYLLKEIPVALTRLQELISRVDVGTSAEFSNKFGETLSSGLTFLTTKVVPLTFGAFEIITASILVIALAAFMAFQPKAYVAGIRRLIPKQKEFLLDECLVRLTLALRQWVLGILTAMTLMGLLTGIGLALVGIEGAFALGVITFFGTFVPYAGAIASAVPGLLVALAQSPTHFWYAFCIYAGVHVIEGYVVEPIVMRKAVEVRPAILLFWQLLMSVWFGPIGILVATPLLLTVDVLIGYFYVERRLGKKK
jgi:predicted PurR-regulated permease PerM